MAKERGRPAEREADEAEYTELLEILLTIEQRMAHAAPKARHPKRAA